MTQRATIENYAQTVRLVREMNIDYHQWKENDWKEEGSRFKEEPVRKVVRTTNAIERRFREVRRRTRPMGVFSDRTSMERILYAVFTYENKKEGTNTPFLLTQNN